MQLSCIKELLQHLQDNSSLLNYLFINAVYKILQISSIAIRIVSWGYRIVTSLIFDLLLINTFFNCNFLVSLTKYCVQNPEFYQCSEYGKSWCGKWLQRDWNFYSWALRERQTDWGTPRGSRDQWRGAVGRRRTWVGNRLMRRTPTWHCGCRTTPSRTAPDVTCSSGSYAANITAGRQNDNMAMCSIKLGIML